VGGANIKASSAQFYSPTEAGVSGTVKMLEDEAMVSCCPGIEGVFQIRGGHSEKNRGLE